MKWLIYLTGITVGSFAGFVAAKRNDAKRMKQQIKANKALIQELQALHGEMHATQQELWRR